MTESTLHLSLRLWSRANEARSVSRVSCAHQLTVGIISFSLLLHPTTTIVVQSWLISWTLIPLVDFSTTCRFRPRILVDVTSVDLSTTVLGFKISMPIMVAPTAMQRMAHPEGKESSNPPSATLSFCYLFPIWCTIGPWPWDLRIPCPLWLPPWPWS